jgi:hypothetical protein
VGARSGLATPGQAWLGLRIARSGNPARMLWTIFVILGIIAFALIILRRA